MYMIGIIPNSEYIIVLLSTKSHKIKTLQLRYLRIANARRENKMCATPYKFIRKANAKGERKRKSWVLSSNLHIISRNECPPSPFNLYCIVD